MLHGKHFVINIYINIYHCSEADSFAPVNMPVLDLKASSVFLWLDHDPNQPFLAWVPKTSLPSPQPGHNPLL